MAVELNISVCQFCKIKVKLFKKVKKIYILKVTFHFCKFININLFLSQFSTVITV